MKNSDTQKVACPTGNALGKATGPAFDQIMNLLITILTKLGLLKEDLDYHVVLFATSVYLLKQDVERASLSAESTKAY